MDSEELDHQTVGIFRRLKAERGSCPQPDELLAFSHNELADARMRALESHLELCGQCREIVGRLRTPVPETDDFTWKRAERSLDNRAAPWRTTRPLWSRRSWQAVAAALLVATPAVWLWLDQQDPGARERSVTRGSSIELREPAGQVSGVDEFRWSALPAHAGFRIQVQRGETLIWEASTRTPRYLPTADQSRLLEPGVPLRWRVQGLDDRGQVLDESPWITFRLVR